MSPRYFTIFGTSLFVNIAKGITLVAKVESDATKIITISLEVGIILFPPYLCIPYGFFRAGESQPLR